jgi:hypothetical protein
MSRLRDDPQPDDLDDALDFLTLVAIAGVIAAILAIGETTI